MKKCCKECRYQDEGAKAVSKGRIMHKCTLPDPYTGKVSESYFFEDDKCVEFSRRQGRKREVM